MLNPSPRPPPRDGEGRGVLLPSPPRGGGRGEGLSITPTRKKPELPLHSEKHHAIFHHPFIHSRSEANQATARRQGWSPPRRFRPRGKRTVLGRTTSAFVTEGWGLCAIESAGWRGC